jgi:hypothetical protein
MEFDSGIIVYSPHGLAIRGVLIFTYGHGFFATGFSFPLHTPTGLLL